MKLLKCPTLFFLLLLLIQTAKHHQAKDIVNGTFTTMKATTKAINSTTSPRITSTSKATQTSKVVSTSEPKSRMIPMGWTEWLLKAMIAKIKIKAAKKIVHLIDDIKNITKKDIGLLKQCYDNVYRGREMDIFERPLKHVIVGYFAHSKKWQRLLRTRQQIRYRIKAFVENLKSLLHMIKVCILRPIAQRTKYGITSISHMTPKEYISMMNRGLHKPYQTKSGLKANTEQCEEPSDNEQIPEEFDWSQKGAVTPVRNQGECGSCFIFAAVGAVESAYLIHKQRELKDNGEQIDISEQAVLDCMNPGSCESGGWPNSAWEHMKNNGVFDEQDKPYESKQRLDQCQQSNNEHSIKVIGWCNTARPSDETIQRILMKHGPVFAAVDTKNSEQWKHLKGPFKGECGESLTHAILIVGWNKDYWLIKNSWGQDWGVDGYLHLPKGENKCGINSVIGFAKLDNN